MTPADESFGSSRTQSIENRQANERKLKGMPGMFQI